MNKAKGVHKQNRFFLVVLIIQVLLVFVFINHHKYDSPVYAIEQINPCVVSINVTGIERKKTIWNVALSGSLILFERKPNKFIPNVTFSLNYLSC